MLYIVACFKCHECNLCKRSAQSSPLITDSCSGAPLANNLWPLRCSSYGNIYQSYLEGEAQGWLCKHTWDSKAWGMRVGLENGARLLTICQWPSLLSEKITSLSPQHQSILFLRYHSYYVKAYIKVICRGKMLYKCLNYLIQKLKFTVFVSILLHINAITSPSSHSFSSTCIIRSWETKDNESCDQETKEKWNK